MSGFTPVKHNVSSSELQTDHCEQGGSAHHLSAASHNYSSQVDNKSQPHLTSTPQPSATQLPFSATNSPAKSGHQQDSIIKPPDQFRTANEEQHTTMHGKLCVWWSRQFGGRNLIITKNNGKSFFFFKNHLKSPRLPSFRIIVQARRVSLFDFFFGENSSKLISLWKFFAFFLIIFLSYPELLF